MEESAARMPKVISVDDIKDWPLYEQIEGEAGRLLFEYLKIRGFHMRPDHLRLLEIVPGFSAISWRVEDNYILSVSPGPLDKVDGSEIYHQGIHSLIEEKFGGKRVGRPGLCLLNEAIGVAFDAYRTFRGLEEGMNPGTFALARYVSIAKTLGIEVKPLIARGCKDPFAEFRAIALENFKMFRFLLSELKRTKNRETVLNRFRSKFRKNKRSVFYAQYSFVSVALYTAVHCGFSSTADDRRAVSECVRYLKKSRSFLEFIELLEIRRFLSRRRKAENAA
jgi:hypothetical protein